MAPIGAILVNVAPNGAVLFKQLYVEPFRINVQQFYIEGLLFELFLTKTALKAGFFL